MKNVISVSDIIFVGGRCMSPDEVARIQAQIDTEKKALQQKTDLAEGERDKAAKELEKRETELFRQQ